MPSYLARVASVDAAEDAAVDVLVIDAPVAVRSRCVVEDMGAGLDAGFGAVVAAMRGGAVVVVFGAVDVVAATRCGMVVVVIGVPDVVTICGFVAFSGEDAAGPAGVTPAFRSGVAVIGAAAGCVFVAVGAAELVAGRGIAAATAAGRAAWRCCHQFQPT
jgi:hypothetical protein